MRTGLSGVLLVATCLLFLPGCGGDDGGGGPTPVTGLEVTPRHVSLEVGHTAELTVKVTGGDSKTVGWYVNGVPNGNSTYGSITGNGPVTYTAPNSLPSPATVVAKAISREDTTRMDSCLVEITFNNLFVDSANGNDESGNGCINKPFRTITKALKQATSGKAVMVRPGTYSDAAGETFTMYVPAGVSLVGENWETCIIRKETSQYNGYTGVMLTGDGASFRKFTLRDGAAPGNDRWDSSVYTAEANSLIDSIRIFERAVMSCIRINTAIDATVQNCVIDVRNDPKGSKIMDRGFEIVFDDQGTIVRNCLVAGHHTGLFFNFPSNALVENCLLEDNTFGAYLCCLNDVNSNPNPDFGGGARGSSGGNTFRNNSNCGLANLGTSDVYAKFNIWDNDPPVEGEDFCNGGDGSIIVE